MVPLAKSALASKKRPVPFMTEAFAKTVRDLASPGLGIADLRVGQRSPEGATQSTLRAGPWLCAQINTLGFGYSAISRDTSLLGDPLILKSRKVAGKASRLALPATDEVRQLREQMLTINAWIADADIDWTEWDEPVDSGQRFMRRIFNDGSLELGGRLFHGFWQEVPKDQRLEYLQINGRRVASLDFSHMGIRLAYAAVGAAIPEGDLYALHGVGSSRDGIKRVLNALLCSDQVPQRFPQNTKGYFPRRLKFASVLEAIGKRHPQLIPMFGTAQSLRQQHTESTIMIKALLTLKDMGVVALPVHDCLLVAHDQINVCKEVLEYTFKQETGIEGLVEVEEGKGGSVTYVSVGSTPPYTLGNAAVLLQKGA